MLNTDFERNSHPAERQTEATADLAVCGITPLLDAETRTHRRVGYKNSVSRFHMLTMSKCNELSNVLQNRTYQPEKGELHEVFEPKYRVTMSSKYVDRVPQSSFVTNYFYPNVIPHLAPSNCACMKNRGVDYARDMFKDILRKASMDDWCFKTDMKSYFASIRHDKLYEEVGQYIIDDWDYWFFQKTVENSSNPVGLDLGSEVYQLSATSFPNRLDHLIGDNYVRYQDDLIFIGTKERCAEILALVRSEADRLGLTISEKKTYMQPVKRPIRFLGFTYLRKPTGRITVKRLPEKVRHERRKLNRMKKKGVSQERVDLHWQAARECLRKGTGSTLHKMDLYIRNLFGGNYDRNTQTEPRTGTPQ